MSNPEELAMDITADPNEKSNEEVEVEVTNEDDTASDDESKQDQEETTTSEGKNGKKKNSSNFKKLAKANKEKEARIKELEAQLGEDSDSDDGDDDGYSAEDLLDFVSDTEGASGNLSGIKEALEEFPGISFEKALKYAQSQQSDESSTNMRFNPKSGTAVTKKAIKDLTAEEAAKLGGDHYDAWRASQKKDINPFG